MNITTDIEQIARELLQAYTDAIKNSNHSASGTLEAKAKSTVEFDGRYFDVYFILQDYWKYLERGTKPHFPPIQAIEEWIRVKRLVPTTNNGRVPSTKQQAYAIARSISINGTPATNTLKKSLDGSDDLIDKLVEVITQQLTDEVNEEIDTL